MTFEEASKEYKALFGDFSTPLIRAMAQWFYLRGQLQSTQTNITKLQEKKK